MPEPVRTPPPPEWDHRELFDRVRESLFAVPASFSSDLVIRGVQATDLFNLNTLLAAAIEDAVVDTLNALRARWDPDEEYTEYAFVRQPQTFPDVRLQSGADPDDVLMGIELKGWYLLAKEKEPSLRFKASPDACALADLIVIYPWHLSEVISGVPKLMTPYVELARYVAEYRNYHWEELMDHKKSPEVRLAEGCTPYPAKADEISDEAVADSGGNFGRIARSGLLESFVAVSGAKLISGIEADHWREFLKIFKEKADRDAVENALGRLGKRLRESWSGTRDEQDRRLATIERMLLAALNEPH